MHTEMDRETRRGYTDKKLYIRQRIFQLISVALLGFIAYDTYLGYVSWWQALLAIIVGLGLGFVMGRLMKVRWDADDERVVTQMDVIGVIAIVAYIILALLRNAVLSQWLSGSALTTISLSLVAGILYGRYLGMRRSIRKVLKENAPPSA